MPALFSPDSLVVTTALELLDTHRPLSYDDESCAACGQQSPCDAALNARQIELATDFSVRYSV
ncbi:hypothetical protein Cs7R123_47530 [Catellatospora sp. TT07R-123]|uniref:hypothetical protein n=1 Tax=Catellatospora sp. TT07R-123 TaxID=2733863 RepID=UPI001B1B10C1|nr:hypothetical protein [Catellatospora sp. TT07R-123]GHJ47411.1 hypothetical protein Cs7R123_47530 [Catellatospora sp. TT07R-123]